MLKSILKKVLLERVLEQLPVQFPNERAKNVGKYYAAEIEKIEIESAGIEENNMAFIQMKNRPKFFYFNVTEGPELITYKFLSDKKKSELPKSYIRCARDIVGRYWYPHMLPDAALTYPYEIRRYFHPQQYDILEDFECSEERKQFLSDKFEFKPGEVVIDECCHTGIGSMVVSELVGETGKFIGLEADPNFFEILDKALSNFNHPAIQYFHKPVWKEKQKTTFSKRTYEQNTFVKDILNSERDSLELEADQKPYFFVHHNLLKKMNIAQSVKSIIN
jgi:hypothetical protein